VTIVVADASVALKWFFRTRSDEADVAAALALLQGVADGGITLIQPPHFVAEVASVLVREAPQTATTDLRDLLAVEMRLDTTDEAVYRRALALAARHRHHLFDTLYHALALCTPGALLVTADEAYWRKACGERAIVRLSDFRPGGP
jgi:predicted nucleic acid-binding protein